MAETTEQVARPRTKPVAYDVFASIHNRVADEGGTVDDVIEAVFTETGVRMTKNNVAVKAANLRRDGAQMGKLASKRSGRKRDIAALNAKLEAEHKAGEAEKANTEGEQAAS